MEKKYDDDDGRVIADMSDLPSQSILGAWFGLRGRQRQKPEEELRPSREELSGEDRRVVMLAAIRAALSIGLVYVVIFAAVIAILLFVWK